MKLKLNLNHTPPMWFYNKKGGDVCAAGGLICQMSPSDIEAEFDFVDANARLIAAAPELLSACLIALSHLENPVGANNRTSAIAALTYAIERSQSA